MGSTRREFLGLGTAAAACLLAGCGPDMRSRRPAPAREEASAVEIPPPISPERYARRRAALAARMREEGSDFLLAVPGAALAYLTGAFLPEDGRLVAWVMEKDGTCRCLAPASGEQAAACSGLPGEPRAWRETEDPVTLLARILSSKGTSPRISAEGVPAPGILEPLGRRLPAARIDGATPLVSALRMRKEPEEIALIQAAIDITLETIRRVMREAREGATAEAMLARAASIAGTLGASMEGAIRFGPGSADPFSGPGKARLRRSDVILFDLTAEVRGYHCTLGRTFAFGDTPPRFRHIYRVVRQAQEEAFRAARPGIPAEKVDEAARFVVQRNGFGTAFLHEAGHGVGLEAREEPFLEPGNDLVLADGMIATVGPGLYFPREFGVRVADIVLVTSTGPRVLSVPEIPPA